MEISAERGEQNESKLIENTAARQLMESNQ
jgi:hypothetical protein